MQNILDYRVLARYLAGEGTPADRRSIEQWAQQSQTNRQQLAAYNSIWKQAVMDGKLQKEQFDADRDWKILKKQIEKQPRTPHSNLATGRSSFYLVMRVAAIFLVVAFIGF